MQFKEIMQSRFSCRKFKPEKLSDELVSEILQITSLSPSSLGLEPWKFVVVSKERHLKELGDICLGQSQVSGASHAIVINARIDLGENDAFMQENIARKGDWLRGICKSRFEKMSSKERFAYASLQCYLATTNLVNAAKSLGVDSCIVAGADFEKLQSWVDLGEAYKSVLVVALGVADAPVSKKMRFSTDKTVLWR